MLSADIRFAMEKIKRVSDTDELTGLYNMRAFTAMLQPHLQTGDALLARSVGGHDRLRQPKDSERHSRPRSGNRLLQHVVRNIRSRCARSDMLARYGGDEFIALLPETDARGAREMGERIRRAIEEVAARRPRHRCSHHGQHRLSPAIPDDGGNLEVIMEKADKAMYYAKEHGRNRVVMASSGAENR